MPTREPGETQNHFVSRYMASKEARKSFPNQAQRAAVAYSEARKGKDKRQGK